MNPFYTSLLQLMGLSAISYAAYKAFDRFQFPASRLVGPIVVIAGLQMTGMVFTVPQALKMAFSIVFGVYLGLRFTKESLGRLKASLVPALVLSVLYIVLTMGYGQLLTALTSMDQYTAFLAVIPGGVAEAGVLALSYGADVAQVSTFQLIRFLSIVTLVPILTQRWLRPYLKEKQLQSATQSVVNNEPLKCALVADDDGVKIQCASSPVESMVKPKTHWLWLFALGGLGSYLFYQVQFPAALLLGATFCVTLAQLLSPRAFKRPPQTYYDIAQIGMGAVIGTSFTLDSMEAVATLLAPLALMTGLILVTSLSLAWLFSKVFKMDYLTAFMGVLPGGLSTMIILAETFDADLVTISSLQLVRLLTAVMVIPILYQILL